MMHESSRALARAQSPLSNFGCDKEEEEEQGEEGSFRAMSSKVSRGQMLVELFSLRVISRAYRAQPLSAGSSHLKSLSDELTGCFSALVTDRWSNSSVKESSVKTPAVRQVLKITVPPKLSGKTVVRPPRPRPVHLTRPQLRPTVTQ